MKTKSGASGKKKKATKSKSITKKAKPTGDQTQYKISSDVIYRHTLMNELTILKMSDMNSYFKLTNIAAKAWFMFVSACSVDQCANKLSKATGYTKEEIAKNLSQLVPKLLKANLLTRA